MKELKTRLRKWGHSFGIVVPLNQVEESSLKDGSEIHVMIVPKENKTNLQWLWGSSKSKTKKSTEQRMKEIDEELGFEY